MSIVKPILKYSSAINRVDLFFQKDIFSCEDEKAEKFIVDKILNVGLEIDKKTPQAVIVYGGDGSLYLADKLFPEIPKIPIRREDEFAKFPYIKCIEHSIDSTLMKVRNGGLLQYELDTIQLIVNNDNCGKAINDITMHNTIAMSAVRYEIFINDEKYGEEIVGDGIVCATPYGSSGYYRSITNSIIRDGIGLAFNNSIESINHIVLGPYDEICGKIIRGPAEIYIDNLKICNLIDGDRFYIIKDCSTKVWGLNAMFCRECKELKTGKSAGWRHV